MFGKVQTARVSRESQLLVSAQQLRAGESRFDGIQHHGSVAQSEASRRCDAISTWQCLTGTEHSSREACRPNVGLHATAELHLELVP